jgi:cytochrome c biogenesis protein CcdA
MLTILTIATVFMAVLLTVVHWQTVREIWKVVREVLMWTSAIVGVLALLGAVIAFIFAAIQRSAELAYLGGGLLVISSILGHVERWDHKRRWAAWIASIDGNKSRKKG